jgi:hypothetical protein
MKTAEEIYERARTLPEALQREALHYLEFLLQRQRAIDEQAEWSNACLQHFASAYGPDDSVYDSV